VLAVSEGNLLATLTHPAAPPGRLLPRLNCPTASLRPRREQSAYDIVPEADTGEPHVPTPSAGSKLALGAGCGSIPMPR
jgi:hypothetical protein